VIDAPPHSRLINAANQFRTCVAFAPTPQVLGKVDGTFA